MIIINVQKLTKPSNAGLAGVEIDVSNKVAEDLADILKRDISGKICEKHPNSNQYVSVIAIKGKVPIIKKGDFCCDEFRDAFKIEQ